jgi:multidrug resistance efflux pump
MKSPQVPTKVRAFESMDVPRAPRRRKLRYGAFVALAVFGVATLALGLHRLRVAPPTIDRSAVWITTVQRGPIVREMQGQGTLVPEEIRWITAKANARVESVLKRPGAMVEPDTVLLELSNSDVELGMLEADRQLSQAEAELVNLQATLTSQKLGQESVVATLGSELGDAERRAKADDELAKKGFLSELERSKTRDHATEVAGRLKFEQKRLAAQSQGIAAQVAAQNAQVERLRAIAKFRHDEVDDLKVRAGVTGMLQELALMPGQTVQSGAMLAKVARPDKLKAELKIHETLAKDLQVGQKASIDTHLGIVEGSVSRIDPAAQAGAVRVDVALVGDLPAGSRPDLTVDGVILIERLDDVLFMSRPTLGQAGSTVGLFKLEDDGTAARTAVKLGRASVKWVEIAGGLQAGDRVVISDMSQWDHVQRIKLR